MTLGPLAPIFEHAAEHGSEWAVAHPGGTVTWGETADDLARTANAFASLDIPRRSRIAIVGAGAAGSAAAEMLRRCGFEGDVTVIDGEGDSPYDRPNLSKDYLAGNAPEEWIPLRPPGFYDEHRITLRRVRATRIDVAGKRVELEDATPVSFDALLLGKGQEFGRLLHLEVLEVHFVSSNQVGDNARADPPGRCSEISLCRSVWAPSFTAGEAAPGA